MDMNVLLFEDFETLDAFGPAEVFGYVEGCRLRFLSMTGGVVGSKQGLEVVTDPIDVADASAVLLIPGGYGTRPLICDETFLEALHGIVADAQYCLTVCTGSALLAKTGLLDGRKATSNKRSFEWVRSVNEAVDWVACARWVTDGKFYTASGVSAGIDMALGFVCDRFGRTAAEEIATQIEYVWHEDKDTDPFARI
mgnify:CR=1 FL=1